MCTEVAPQWEPPKKKGVLGAEKGEGAGRGGTGDRAVRLGGLGLLPSADAEARKSG